jgi:predicted phosphate transport protein (TIGR00153 family)
VVPVRRAMIRLRTADASTELARQTVAATTASHEGKKHMLGLFKAIMPKEDKFFDLFSAHAATLVQGARALRDLLQGGEAIEAAAARVYQHEEEADEITRQVMQAVRRTFITPFDRSDIQDLTTSLDDAIDQMRKTAKVVSLFEVRNFEPQMQAMGEIIVQAAELTAQAVALLPKMALNAHTLSEIAVKITQIEEQSDVMYDEGRKALFLASREGDPMAFIVGVDIYSHLEKVMDRFEDVANRISGIVVEQV